MATRDPVTVGGWYEETDGRVAEYRWRNGQPRRERVVASWAEVPERPSWATPESHP